MANTLIEIKEHIYYNMVDVNGYTSTVLSKLSALDAHRSELTLKEAYLKMKGEKTGEFQSFTKQNLSPTHTIITNVSEEYIMTAIFEE